jgi:glycosyltransferase involved in cell wall biosynthesis
MTSSVSVIIPSYNSARYVADAIRSARAQTVPPTQIIVVNDGSTDDTEKVLEAFAGQITVIRQANAGLPSARNAGLRVATGDWIGFLDADDAWHPQKLELQLRTARSDPDVGLIGTATFDFPNELPPSVDGPGRLERIPLERLLVRNHFTASSVLVRGDVARRVGEFDPPLPNAEDWDYWQRTAEICPVAMLALPLTGYRQVPGSLSRRAFAMEVGIERVLAKLDARDSWKGDRWLRRRAFAQFYFGVSHLYSCSGMQRAALLRVLRSFLSYPFPMDRRDTSAPLARPRRALVLLMRSLGLMPIDTGMPGNGRPA